MRASANLSQLAEPACAAIPIVRARNAEEVPLRTAVGLIARQRLTGEAPPKAALSGLDLLAPWIEEKAAAELDALALTLDDQAAFAKLSRRLLEDLDLAAAQDPSEQEPETAGDDEQGDDGGSEDGADEGEDATPAAAKGASEAKNRDRTTTQCADSWSRAIRKPPRRRCRRNAQRRPGGATGICRRRPTTTLPTRHDEIVEAHTL